MKAFKVTMVVASLFVSTFAHAEYKWISLTAEQLKSINSTCEEQKKIALRDGAVMTSGAGAAGYMATTALQDGGGPIGFTVGGAALSSMAAAGAALYRGLFSVNEIQILLMEKQANSPGLMTVKLEQIAAENNYDLTKLLAVLNLMGINNKVCTPVDGPGISTLAQVQEVEKKKLAKQQAKEQAAADEQALRESEAKKEEYRKKQQELIVNQIPSK